MNQWQSILGQFATIIAAPYFAQIFYRLTCGVFAATQIL